MEGHHPSPGRLSRWRYPALTLALAFAGLSLIRAALVYPAEPPMTPIPRLVARVASDRGQRPAVLQAAPAPMASQPGLADPLLPNTRALRALTPVPTAIPVRTEVIQYTVVKGDTLLALAERFQINLDTIIWANMRLELDPDLISIGDEINILPVIGVWHTVRQGEALAGVAAYYKVTPEQITGYTPNKLRAGDPLTAGQKLIIPGGIKPWEAHYVYTEGGAALVNASPEPGRFMWPCTGIITTLYSKYHLALDIANHLGTPLYAADAGTVVQAGELGTLGLNVQINHGNGFQTFYGHMDRVLVQQGQYVQRGQQIGEMGSTGKSTGPHIHFIVRLWDGAVNPAHYLPRQ